MIKKEEILGLLDLRREKKQVKRGIKNFRDILHNTWRVTGLRDIAEYLDEILDSFISYT